MTIDSVKKMKDALCEKLKVSFGSTVEEASDAQMMRASALVLRDVMAERSVDTMRETREEHRRQVHYLSMEFLMGRSLMKNAFNLGVGEILTEALDELGFRAADIFESEPDAGLGNGGLGRLAACYLDSMTTLDIPAAGYSICYELGIFRQRIVDGQQVELPDNWKDLGGAWLLPKPQETETVCFGGPPVLGRRAAACRARGRDRGAGYPLRYGDRGLRHGSCEHAAPLGCKVPRAARHVALFTGRISARAGAARDGRDHRKGALS